MDSHGCCLFCYLQESENPENTVVPEQVDEYVDIDDEMPTATYQSVEIKKGAEAMSVSGGLASGSSSSSCRTVKLTVYSFPFCQPSFILHELNFLQCFPFDFLYRFRVRELRGQRLRSWRCSFSCLEEVILTVGFE